MNVFSSCLQRLKVRWEHLIDAYRDEPANAPALGDRGLVFPEDEQGPVATSLSLALLQMGLIRHLPEPPLPIPKTFKTTPH